MLGSDYVSHSHDQPAAQGLLGVARYHTRRVARGICPRGALELPDAREPDSRIRRAAGRAAGGDPHGRRKLDPRLLREFADRASARSTCRCSALTRSRRTSKGSAPRRPRRSPQLLGLPPDRAGGAERELLARPGPSTWPTPAHPTGATSPSTRWCRFTTASTSGRWRPRRPGFSMFRKSARRAPRSPSPARRTRSR